MTEGSVIVLSVTLVTLVTPVTLVTQKTLHPSKGVFAGVEY